MSVKKELQREHTRQQAAEIDVQTACDPVPLTLSESLERQAEELERLRIKFNQLQQQLHTKIDTLARDGEITADNIATVKRTLVTLSKNVTVEVRAIQATMTHLVESNHRHIEQVRQQKNNVMNHMRRNLYFNPNLSNGLGVPLVQQQQQQLAAATQSSVPPVVHTTVFPQQTLVKNAVQHT